MNIVAAVIVTAVITALYIREKDKKKIEAAYHFFEQKGYEVYSTQFLLC